MTELEKLLKCVEVLNTLRTDAEMALQGEWDRSDQGFEDQIELINQTLTEIT